MLSVVMAASETLFELSVPPGCEAPARMPSPFAPGSPHPVARSAADRLRAELASGLGTELGLAHDGKMFGVLVVADRAGRLGVLRGFSGMVAGCWELPGFVPPAFDRTARDAFWIAGEQGLVQLANQIAILDGELARSRGELAALEAAQASEAAALREQLGSARQQRHRLRALASDAAARATLDRESARDSQRKDAQKRAHRSARAALVERIAPLAARRAALDDERAARSRDLLVLIHATYRLPNARGELRGLRELFAPHEPPGGAGDCAAPKLLAHAYRHGLRPIALAELWCGAPPPTGGRHDGEFYPACRGKCGPILTHMLTGLPHEPHPVFGEDAIDPAAPHTLFEDRWLAVIVKPAGLLSVPGRSGKADSVLARLRRRYPGATGPLLVHRLDLDTSGVMLVAKDLATHAALQRQFAERTLASMGCFGTGSAERLLDKRYVAWLDGEPADDRGTVELPLRVDLDDRPRQIVDHVHGKPARTEWQVLSRVSGRARVALYPRTGRSHQLRVHAAHPDGLGVPIVGDRLYGRSGSAPGDRLLLHAEAIELVHPHTHERLRFEQPAPF